MALKLIEFKSFNPIHTVITIPKNTLLLRGYHTGYPAVSDRPAYFTSYKEIVDAYAKKDQHTLGYFKTTSDIKLLDLRYIKLLLRDFFDTQHSTTIRQYSNVTDCMMSICMALGLCSVIVQMNLVNKRYSESMSDKNSDIYKGLLSIDAYFKKPNAYNPIDPQGIRIAETNNDILMILCLREIFGNDIQGYIMPDVFSPFHIEKTNNTLNAEIVIFNPLESHIQLMNVQGNPDLSKLEIYTIHEVYKNEPYTVLKMSYTNMNPTSVVIKRGGTQKDEHNPNAFFDIGGAPYNKLLKYTQKAMRRLLKQKKQTRRRKTSGGEESVHPNFVVNPTIPISPFDVEELTAFFEKRKEFQFPQ